MTIDFHAAAKASRADFEMRRSVADAPTDAVSEVAPAPTPPVSAPAPRVRLLDAIRDIIAGPDDIGGPIEFDALMRCLTRRHESGALPTAPHAPSVRATLDKAVRDGILLKHKSGEGMPLSWSLSPTAPDQKPAPPIVRKRAPKPEPPSEPSRPTASELFGRVLDLRSEFIALRRDLEASGIKFDERFVELMIRADP